MSSVIALIGGGGPAQLSGPNPAGDPLAPAVPFEAILQTVGEQMDSLVSSPSVSSGPAPDQAGESISRGDGLGGGLGADWQTLEAVALGSGGYPGMNLGPLERPSEMRMGSPAFPVFYPAPADGRGGGMWGESGGDEGPAMELAGENVGSVATEGLPPDVPPSAHRVAASFGPVSAKSPAPPPPQAEIRLGEGGESVDVKDLLSRLPTNPVSVPPDGQKENAVPAPPLQDEMRLGEGGESVGVEDLLSRLPNRSASVPPDGRKETAVPASPLQGEIAVGGDGQSVGVEGLLSQLPTHSVQTPPDGRRETVVPASPLQGEIAVGGDGQSVGVEGLLSQLPTYSVPVPSDDRMETAIPAPPISVRGEAPASGTRATEPSAKESPTSEERPVHPALPLKMAASQDSRRTLGGVSGSAAGASGQRPANPEPQTVIGIPPLSTSLPIETGGGSQDGPVPPDSREGAEEDDAPPREDALPSVNVSHGGQDSAPALAGLAGIPLEWVPASSPATPEEHGRPVESVPSGQESESSMSTPLPPAASAGRWLGDSEATAPVDGRTPPLQPNRPDQASAVDLNLGLRGPAWRDPPAREGTIPDGDRPSGRGIADAEGPPSTLSASTGVHFIPLPEGADAAAQSTGQTSGVGNIPPTRAGGTTPLDLQRIVSGQVPSGQPTPEMTGPPDPPVVPLKPLSAQADGGPDIRASYRPSQGDSQVEAFTSPGLAVNAPTSRQEELQRPAVRARGGTNTVQKPSAPPLAGKDPLQAGAEFHAALGTEGGKADRSGPSERTASTGDLVGPAAGTHGLQPGVEAPPVHPQGIRPTGEAVSPVPSTRAGIQTPPWVPPTTPPRIPGDPPASLEVMEQVVKGARFLLQDSVSEVRVRLEPPELGSVHIRVVSERNSLSGEIVVSSHEIKGIVESNLHQLRSSLTDQGLHLGQIDVAVRGDGDGRRNFDAAGGFRQDDPRDQRGNSGQNGGTDGGRKEDRRPRAGRTLVDYFA